MIRLGKRRNYNKGVTLIELVVVLAIIGIMALFMTPGIGEWVQNYRIKQAARDMASDFQFAKLKAISSGRYCTLAFNLTVGGTQQSYVIFPDYDNDLQLDSTDIGDLDNDGDQENETTDIFKTVILSNQYRSISFDTSRGDGNDGIDFTNNNVAFDSRGLARNSAGAFENGHIFLINTENEKARRVDVSAAGAISIVEYQ